MNTKMMMMARSMVVIIPIAVKAMTSNSLASSSINLTTTTPHYDNYNFRMFIKFSICPEGCKLKCLPELKASSQFAYCFSASTVDCFEKHLDYTLTCTLGCTSTNKFISLNFQFIGTYFYLFLLLFSFCYIVAACIFLTF